MFGKNQIITNNFLTFSNFLYDVFAQKIMGRTAIEYYQFTSVPVVFEVTAGGFIFKTDPNTVDVEIWVYDNIDYYGYPPFNMFPVIR